MGVCLHWHLCHGILSFVPPGQCTGWKRAIPNESHAAIPTAIASTAQLVTLNKIIIAYGGASHSAKSLILLLAGYLKSHLDIRQCPY